MPKNDTPHNVEFDYAGWGSHPRFTCYTCEGKTLLKQPWMSTAKWTELVTAYSKKHPSEVVTEYLAQLVVFGA